MKLDFIVLHILVCRAFRTRQILVKNNCLSFQRWKEVFEKYVKLIIPNDGGGPRNFAVIWSLIPSVVVHHVFGDLLTFLQNLPPNEIMIGLTIIMIKSCCVQNTFIAHGYKALKTLYLLRHFLLLLISAGITSDFLAIIDDRPFLRAQLVGSWLKTRGRLYQYKPPSFSLWQ